MIRTSTSLSICEYSTLRSFHYVSIIMKEQTNIVKNSAFENSAQKFSREKEQGSRYMDMKKDTSEGMLYSSTS